MEDFKVGVEGLKFRNDKLDTYVAETLSNSIENPIYINLDSGVDWGVVLIGIAGIATSAIVGYFGYRAQRNQIRANACSLRHHWINELRSCATAFMQINSTIIHRSWTEEGYDTSADYYADYNKSLELHIKIKFMVSNTSELGQKIHSLSDSLVELVKEVRYQCDDKADEACDALAELQNHIKQQLDRAWDDIKGDLGLRGGE